MKNINISNQLLFILFLCLELFVMEEKEMDLKSYLQTFCKFK